MKIKAKLLAMLNQYIRMRELIKSTKQSHEALREEILATLPPNTANEWELEGWGRVTHHAPKDSAVVDLEKLKRHFPKAYLACVSTKPSEPRFCVYPTKDAYVAAWKEKSRDIQKVEINIPPN